MSALLNIGKKALPYAGAAAGFALGGPAGAAAGYAGTKALTNAVASNTYDKPKPAPTPDAPTLDTAQTAASQQQDLLRRRRGVLSNIYAGSKDQASPQVATKALLGM